ncbi:hypothetical protein SORBI_3003G135101 [Sorghum bicolor]|uniref:ZF-HD dimerization-type domain-containing protein n=1 Tax=Sorghum bicolor TaxID=4558 RepID=A0A1W0VX74_SORBI|nr:hypothetical protein SORBI_3003G135101 [Sorghum bicolor]
MGEADPPLPPPGLRATPAQDGCGEFMPSLEADPADPSSLRCATCRCHRNFHRRLAELPRCAVRRRRTTACRPPSTRRPRRSRTRARISTRTARCRRYRARRARASKPPAVAPRPPPPPASASLGPMPPAPPETVVPGAAAARKRFRTKFSPEQKQRMQALSERLGWRLQKRGEALVDECCQEMGVFKVWMHNNKHNFVGGHNACRSASASAAAAAAIHHHPSNHGPGWELGLLRVRVRRRRLRLLPLPRGAATDGYGGEQAGRRG